MPTVLVPAPPSERPDLPAPAVHPAVHRAVTVHVAGGLDGVLRVVAMLRGRGYRVRDLSVDVREGVVESRVDVTAVLTPDEAHLLLQRLRRTPAVVSAEPV